jgi:hypothetical protein
MNASTVSAKINGQIIAATRIKEALKRAVLPGIRSRRTHGSGLIASPNQEQADREREGPRAAVVRTRGDARHVHFLVVVFDRPYEHPL